MSIIPFEFRSHADSTSDSNTLVVHVPTGLTTDAELFRLFEREVRLPDYFGENWNALDETLRDLHWVSERKLIFVHDDLPGLPTDSLRIYLEVLANAVNSWEAYPEHEIAVIFPENTKAQIASFLSR